MTLRRLAETPDVNTNRVESTSDLTVPSDELSRSIERAVLSSVLIWAAVNWISSDGGGGDVESPWPHATSARVMAQVRTKYAT